ncbi:MAG TPA: Ig-like domain-containing protein, partial [Caulobacteraceae bacterium]|nr:Ig-like domain-containing protein [Caulobacteraceae bacterium]
DITTSASFADGQHTLTATQADAAGLTSTASAGFAVAVDPTAPSITALVGQPANGSTIHVTGTGAAGDIIHLFADGGTTVVGSGVVAANGTFNITTSTHFADGSHTLTATQTDTAGLTSPASTGFGVSIAPDAPTITALIGQPVNGSTIRIGGTGEAGETIKLFADGGTTVVGSGVVAANGTFNITTSATFADGKHTLTATQTDASGLTSQPSIQATIPVIPQTPALTALVGDPTAGWTVEFQGTGAEAGETVKLLDNGVSIGTAIADSTGAFDIKTPTTITPGASGTTTTNFSVSETDSQGLQSAVSSPVPVTIAAAGTYYLTTLAETIKPQGAATLNIASSADLNPADVVDLSGATSTTVKLGGGVFDLAAVSGLDNITTITVPTVATTAQVTAAQATAKIVGNSSGTVLEIVTGGAVALNAADKTVLVQLDQATDLTLAAGANNVLGSAGNDTLIATATNIVAAASYDGGGGTNTLDLSGAGVFALGKPATLVNFQVVDVTAGQTVTLKNGTSLTVDVQEASGPGAVIIGANNSDTINLGAGSDTVTLGSANETVDSGTGAGLIHATSATAGALLTGGGLTLDLTGGGAVTLNANDTGVATVNLAASTLAYTFTANGESLVVNDLSKAGDKIVLGADADTVNLSSAGASNTVIGGAGLSTVNSNAVGQTGALLTGGMGGLTLDIKAGGVNTMNAGDTGVTQVNLTAATGNTTFVANAEAGLVVDDLAVGKTKITLGGADQTVIGAPTGGLTLVESAQGGDTLKATVAALKTNTITGFAGAGSANTIDVTDFSTAQFASATFKENANATQGTLTLNNGTATASVILFGQFAAANFNGTAAAAGFAAVSDGATGSTLTWVAPGH